MACAKFATRFVPVSKCFATNCAGLGHNLRLTFIRGDAHAALSRVRYAILTIRNLTRQARRFIERSIMSVITVKRTVIKRTPNKASTTRRSFRELTRSHFASEKSWEFVIEALFFAIIVAISAWPIFAAADALHEFLQRTAS
jgi:hypothetical protein